MEDHVDGISNSIKNLAKISRSGSRQEYKKTADEIVFKATKLRTFLSDIVLKINDLSLKQSLNFNLMQLSDSISLLVQSSLTASSLGSTESVQTMVNCAVKIARLTKETHDLMVGKIETL